MAKLLKFLNKVHADTVASGNFRLGSSHYYQLLECVYEDEWIGDIEECSSSNTLEKYEAPNLINEHDRRALNDVGIHVDRGYNGGLKIRNFTTINSPLHYILSFTFDNLEDSLHMVGQKSGSTYDSCVSFEDPAEIERALINATFQNPNADEVKFSDFFSSISHGHVAYRRNSGPYDMKRLYSPDPFLKNPKYACQKEYRFVLTPKRENRSIDYILANSAALGTIEKIPIESSTSPGKEKDFDIHADIKSAFYNIKSYMRKNTYDGSATGHIELQKSFVKIYWRFRNVYGASKELDYVVLNRHMSPESYILHVIMCYLPNYLYSHGLIASSEMF